MQCKVWITVLARGSLKKGYGMSTMLGTSAKRKL